MLHHIILPLIVLAAGLTIYIVGACKKNERAEELGKYICWISVLMALI